MAAKQTPQDALRHIEEGTDFLPKFDSNGLINAIAQDAKTGQVLMAAFMNQQALDLTIQTGFATYFSRSRQKLWKKGEESGHFQKVEQILVDCDQDCLILKVTVDAGQCHVGYQSCFYRALEKSSSNKPAFSPASPKRVEAGEVSPKGGLEFIAEKTYNPKETYPPRLTRPSASPRGEREFGRGGQKIKKLLPPTQTYLLDIKKLTEFVTHRNIKSHSLSDNFLDLKLTAL